MFCRLLGRYSIGYTPSIKFPNRHGSHASNIIFSGKKIKMTNREALNQAMSE
jgi:hypothetical protein